MSPNIAEIALMYVLPLGITFITILLTASAEYRHHKIIGALFSLIVVTMDCMFYFAKNSFVSYNTDGGLLLAFSSMIFLGLIHAVRSEDRAAKFANFMFSFLMFVAFIGIAYWERPTLLVTASNPQEEIAKENAKYQDYIASFQNSNNEAAQPRAVTTVTRASVPAAAVASDPQAEPAEEKKFSDNAKGRLDKYIDETGKVIERMNSVIESINNFGKLPANISESEREKRSSQALAINNNATAINKKTLGLFHPHESTEAHSELIQASESVRLAAYSLYTYTLQEDPQEQANQYNQARSQIAQARVSLDRFNIDIQNLISNYQSQPEE